MLDLTCGAEYLRHHWSRSVQSCKNEAVIVGTAAGQSTAWVNFTDGIIKTNIREWCGVRMGGARFLAS